MFQYNTFPWSFRNLQFESIGLRFIRLVNDSISFLLVVQYGKRLNFRSMTLLAFISWLHQAVRSCNPPTVVVKVVITFTFFFLPTYFAYTRNILKSICDFKWIQKICSIWMMLAVSLCIVALVTTTVYSSIFPSFQKIITAECPVKFTCDRNRSPMAKI